MTLFSWFENNQQEESTFTLRGKSSTLTYNNKTVWPVARVKLNSSSINNNFEDDTTAVPKSMKLIK